jgi:hypothetical protein
MPPPRPTVGAPHWRARKLIEARELLALAQIAPPGRLRVDYLELADDLARGLHAETCRVAVRALDDAGSGAHRARRDHRAGLSRRKR